MLQRTLLVFFSFFTLTSSLSAQVNPFDSTKYTVQELQEDFNYMRSQIKRRGTVIYLYNTKKQTDQYFDSLYQCIKEPMTAIEFFRLVAPLQAFIKDVHTSVFPGEAIRKSFFENQQLFPIDIEIIDGKVYVQENYSSNPQLNGKQEMISINGVPMDSVIYKCSLMLPRDGYDTGHPISWLNSDFLYYYYFIYGPSEVYQLELKTKEGETQVETIQGMSLKTIWSAIDERYPNMEERNIYTEVNDSLKTVTLTIRSFSDNDLKVNQKGSLKKIVDEQFEIILKTGYSNLIIDVRGNDGGNSGNAKKVLKYLLNSPFKIKQSVRVVKNKEAEALMKRTRPALYGQFERGTYRPHKKRFTGEVYVLVNSGSTSAAGVFASALDRHNRATFIGTEMGGNPIVLGGSLWFNSKKTPNTKIAFMFGDKCSILNNLELNTGHGLIPDIVLENSYESFLLNQDNVMLFALKRISGL